MEHIQHRKMFCSNLTFISWIFLVRFSSDASFSFTIIRSSFLSWTIFLVISFFFICDNRYNPLSIAYYGFFGRVDARKGKRKVKETSSPPLVTGEPVMKVGKVKTAWKWFLCISSLNEFWFTFCLLVLLWPFIICVWSTKISNGHR